MTQQLCVLLYTLFLSPMPFKLESIFIHVPLVAHTLFIGTQLKPLLKLVHDSRPRPTLVQAHCRGTW